MEKEKVNFEDESSVELGRYSYQSIRLSLVDRLIGKSLRNFEGFLGKLLENV